MGNIKKILGGIILVCGLLQTGTVFSDYSVKQTAADTPTLATTATPTIQATPTPTPIVYPTCSETKGTIQQYQFDSKVLGKPFYLRVYTPPCYDASGKTPYPVLYMLHGQSFNDDQWDRLGLDETADRLISSGKITPLIIVMPQETEYLADTLTSKYGDAIVTELMPWVEKQYPTITDRTHRAIGGLSRGAGWAMRIGLNNPDLFGSVGTHSLAQLKGDYFAVPTWRNKTPNDLLPRIYMDVGLLDEVKDTAKKFEVRLSEYSYPHEWHLSFGNHTEKYWSAHVEEYLLWYSQGWMPIP
jgi:enterochelin esterase-like enzyme